MYFKGQILPNLMLLAFDESGIWPNSPKQWIDQLEKCDNDKVKKIIESHDNDIVFNEICSSEEKNFIGLEVVKRDNNNITFLG